MLIASVQNSSADATKNMMELRMNIFSFLSIFFVARLNEADRHSVLDAGKCFVSNRIIDC